MMSVSYAADIDASLSVTPTYPSPHDTVIVTLASYSFDVNTAEIIWKSGNKTLLSGTGQKRLSVTLGNAGQVVPISYTAKTAAGLSVSGSITLTPQSVDLLFETDESYVPPFYEGKALPGEGSVIRVIAVPSLYESGGRVAPTSLAYNWYVNGEYLDRASGVGRQSATIGMEYLTHATDVRVLIRSPRGTTAEKVLTVYPHDVLPILYPYDEILGTDFTKPLIRRMEVAGGIRLSLEPFYFSTKSAVESTASYGWYVDGLPVTAEQNTLLSLTPQENSVGTRMLSVVLENSKRLLQKTRSDIEIIFDTRN